MDQNSVYKKGWTFVGQIDSLDPYANRLESHQDSVCRLMVFPSPKQAEETTALPTGTVQLQSCWQTCSSSVMNKDLSVAPWMVRSSCSAGSSHLAALVNRPGMTNGAKHDHIHWLADNPLKHWQEWHFKNRSTSLCLGGRLIQRKKEFNFFSSSLLATVVWSLQKILKCATSGRGAINTLNDKTGKIWNLSH